MLFFDERRRATAPLLRRAIEVERRRAGGADRYTVRAVVFRLRLLLPPLPFTNRPLALRFGTWLSPSRTAADGGQDEQQQPEAATAA